MNVLIVVQRHRDDRPRHFRRDVHHFGLNPAVPGPWRDHVRVPYRHGQYSGNADHDECREKPNKIPDEIHEEK